MRSRRASDSEPAAQSLRPATGSSPNVLLTLWTEQRAGQGEDAEPLAMTTGPASGAVAVFDGLGGSGGSVVTTRDGEQSQARIAATTARAAVHRLLQRMEPAVDGGSGAASVLAGELCRALGEVVEQLGLGGGRLRSKLIRTLPTTVALARYERGVDGVRCEAIWAGDSRVYVLTPSDGLQQLTEDDLRSGGDALENLRQDSPMSNLVSASGPFVLHQRVVDLPEEPAIVIAATDGCFGYVPTPWHFEHLLLDAMRNARDHEGWTSAVQAAILAVAGDDASMGIAILHARSFQEMRRAFETRAGHIAAQVRQIEEADRTLVDARAALAEAERRAADLRTSQWASYRPGFEHWLRAAGKVSTAPFTVSAPAAAELPPGGRGSEGGERQDHGPGAGAAWTEERRERSDRGEDGRPHVRGAGARAGEGERQDHGGAWSTPPGVVYINCPDCGGMHPYAIVPGRTR